MGPEGVSSRFGGGRLTDAKQGAFLLTSGWAFVHARLREYEEKYDSEAEERQKRKPKSVVENLPPQDQGKARDKAGEAVNVTSIAAGEYAENQIRKDFTTSERVAIVETFATFTHGGDRKSKQEQNLAVDSMSVDEAAKNTSSAPTP